MIFYYVISCIYGLNNIVYDYITRPFKNCMEKYNNGYPSEIWKYDLDNLSKNCLYKNGIIDIVYALLKWKKPLATMMLKSSPNIKYSLNYESFKILCETYDNSIEHKYSENKMENKIYVSIKGYDYIDIHKMVNLYGKSIMNHTVHDVLKVNMIDKVIEFDDYIKILQDGFPIEIICTSHEHMKYAFKDNELFAIK